MDAPIRRSGLVTFPFVRAIIKLIKFRIIRRLNPVISNVTLQILLSYCLKLLIQETESIS